MGILDKIKDLNAMRQEAKQLELALGQIQVTGSSSGGKVTITMDGNQNVQSVVIADTIVGDRSEIGRHVRAALEDLFKQHKKALQSKFGSMLQG